VGASCTARTSCVYRLAVAQIADIEALALLEIDGIARAIRAQDEALKRAHVAVLTCAPVSPAKALLVLGGGLANIEEAISAADAVVGSRRIDYLLIPAVHKDVVSALLGQRRKRQCEALAICELATAATTLGAADAAVKTAPVYLGRLHLATGFGGRGFFTLFGQQSDIEAAVERVAQTAGDKLLDHEIIPAPHDELEAAAFVRAWPVDHADPAT
jgi:microcompartment protein CcmL/EutN